MTSEPQEPKEQQEPETDAVDAAFRAMRAAARRRGGRLPDLAAQGRSVRPRRSVAKPLAARDASTSGEEDAGPVIPGFTQFADLSGADRRAVLGTRGQWRAGSRGRPSGPDGRRMRRSYSVPRLGAVLGKTVYKSKESLLPKVNSRNPILYFLQLCGKHSLWIYLLHQPVLSGVCMLLTHFA